MGGTMTVNSMMLPDATGVPPPRTRECIRKVIPYKEYKAHKAAEAKASTTSEPTVEDEKDRDEELLPPPHVTPPGLNLSCNHRKVSRS